MEEMDTEFQQQQTASEHTPSFTMKQLLTSTDLRLPLFVACMLQVIQQFSGINAVSRCSAVFDCLNTHPLKKCTLCRYLVSKSAQSNMTLR
jgi:hypothetical protein